MSKGAQMPINIMVTLAIGVVVMLAIVAFFMGGIRPQGESSSAIQRFNSCCFNYVVSGCPVADDGFALDMQCSEGGLRSLATRANIATHNIRRACGCTGTSTTGTTTAAVNSNRDLLGEGDDLNPVEGGSVGNNFDQSAILGNGLLASPSVSQGE